MKKTTYDIRYGVINPEYIGVITEPRDENYRFEDFRKTPERIYNKCRQYDTVVLLANGNINVNYTYDEAIGIL